MNRQRFFENKDRLIDRLESLTSEQKEEIKSFFTKHPSYESKIDWNDKSLSYKDFGPILALDGKSKTQARKKGIEGITEGKDYEYLGEGYNEEIGNYRLYRPLTYLGSMTLASNRVPPVKENGAKWCIVYQKTDSYWKNYTKRGIKFIFICTDDTKYAVTLYPKAYHYKKEVYSFDDSRLGLPAWLEDVVLSKVGPEYIPSEPPIEKVVARYVRRKVFVKNPDGTYSKVGLPEVDATRFIRDGRIAIPFDFWEGYFNISSQNVVSLENAPKKVTGSFYCSQNDLQTLEGAPQEVGGDFVCSYCHLNSLVGGPSEVGGIFDCRNNRLTALQGAPKHVGGSFLCSQNSLITLEGGPEYVGGHFQCFTNKLTSLKGAPRTVKGIFDCSNNNLTSLKGAPGGVWEFSCNRNSLTSLKGAPEYVDGSFSCTENQLTSLVGSPSIVKGSFNCTSNRLTSLKGAPTSVGGNFYCYDNASEHLERPTTEIYGEFFNERNF